MRTHQVERLHDALTRRASKLIAAACVVALGTLGLGAVSGASTTIAQARAQAVNVGLLSGVSTVVASNPPTSATSDGSSSQISQNSPAISALSSQSLIGAGSLAELAAAYATGTSYACAGILQSGGGTVQIGPAGNCITSDGSGAGATITLNQLPGVGTQLSNVGTVAIQLDAVVAFAEATPSGAIGSVGLAGGAIDVFPNGAPANIAIPFDPSSAPNENLLTEVVAALTAQQNPALQTTINALSSAVAPLVQLVTNSQTTSGGTLRVTALHVALAGTLGASANLATVWVGPNSALPGGSSMAPSGPPSVSGITPTSGPASGGTFVAITGSNLLGATSVTFGGVPASFIGNADGSLTAVAPAGSGAVDVVASDPAGVSPATANDRFTYESSGGLSGSAAGANGAFGSSSGNANTASVCPNGTRPTSYIYTLPLTVQIGDAAIRSSSRVIGRIVEGNRIVVSTSTLMPTTHAITIRDTKTSQGMLTGELVFNKRVVERAPVPLSAPVLCGQTSVSTRSVTFATRVPNYNIGSRLPGGIFVKGRKVQSFSVQVRANHVVSFVDRTPVAGGVAKILRPGSKIVVVIATIKGTSS